MEQVPRRRIGSAAQVSRALREAGFEKAGRYTPVGYMDGDQQQDGFIVVVDKKYGGRGVVTVVTGCTVLHSTASHRSENSIFDQMLEALLARGFEARRSGSSLKVAF